MSAYNTLRVYLECQSCGDKAERDVQFRYGHVWLYEYAVGSVLQWGPAAVGDQGASRVAVDGWLDECPKCSFEGRVAVFIREGIFCGVGPTSWVPALPELGWIPIEGIGA